MIIFEIATDELIYLAKHLFPDTVAMASFTTNLDTIIHFLEIIFCSTNCHWRGKGSVANHWWAVLLVACVVANNPTNSHGLFKTYTVCELLSPVNNSFFAE